MSLGGGGGQNMLQRPANGPTIQGRTPILTLPPNMGGSTGGGGQGYSGAAMGPNLQSGNLAPVNDPTGGFTGGGTMGGSTGGGGQGYNGPAMGPNLQTGGQPSNGGWVDPRIGLREGMIGPNGAMVVRNPTTGQLEYGPNPNANYNSQTAGRADYQNRVGDGFTGTRNGMNFVNGNLWAPEGLSQGTDPNTPSFAFSNFLRTYMGQGQQGLGALNAYTGPLFNGGNPPPSMTSTTQPPPNQPPPPSMTSATMPPNQNQVQRQGQQFRSNRMANPMSQMNPNLLKLLAQYLR